MMTVWLVTGVILLSAAIVFMYRPCVPPVLPAYAGLWTLRLSGLVPLSPRLMLFWGAAAVIVLAIDFLRQPRAEVRSTVRTYVVSGAFAGALLGLVISPAAGIVAGAALGAVAFGMTPAGRVSAVPVVETLCSVGLPAVVTCSIVAVALQSVIAASVLQ